MKSKTRLYMFSLVVFILFIYLAVKLNVKTYIADSVLIIILLTIFYTYYEKLNLNAFAYLIIFSAFILHNSGVFGFYYQSPLKYFDPVWEMHISPHPFQWDHITHFFGMLAFSILLFNYLSKYFTKNKFTNFMIILSIFLAVQGLGALTELYEFAGYLSVGEGEGALGRGAGDYSIYWVSSDWLNTMFDLVYNALGSLVGIAVAYIIYKNKYHQNIH